MLESMFGMFDLDNDGRLSAAELGVGYMALESTFGSRDDDDDDDDRGRYGSSYGSGGYGYGSSGRRGRDDYW